jgi:site-specific DNA-adenine methylase
VDKVLFSKEGGKMRPLCASPGGKFKLAKKIIRFFPQHRTYVEPFCGSASVALAKKPSEKDIISDIDDFAFCYNFLKNASDETINQLEKMEWQANPSLYHRLKQFTAKSAVDRFRKFFYVRRHTYGTKANGVMNPQPTRVNINKFRQLRDGLKHIDVFQDDYKNIVQKYDAPDTFFFFDPPYHQSWGKEWGANKFNFQEFVGVLKNLKGKFLLTYEDDKTVRSLLSGFKFKKLPVIRTLDGTNNVQQDYDLLVFNYDPVPNMVYLSEDMPEFYETLFEFVDYAESDDDNFTLRIPQEVFFELQTMLQRVPKRVPFTDKAYNPAILSDAELQNDIEDLTSQNNGANYDTFPGWESSGTEIKYRVKDPALFEKESFVRKVLKKDSPQVSAVMAKLKGQDTLTIQSLRFPKKDGWTVDKAQAWYKTHYSDDLNLSEVLGRTIDEALTRSNCFITATGEAFNSLKSKVTSGLYMSEKYVSLLKNGSATMIAKARPYDGMLNKPLWLCDDKNVHGVVKLTDCKKVESVEEFNSFVDKHKIDDEERMRTFGKDRTEFYLYSATLISILPSPVPYLWKSGVQGFVRNVQFVPKEGGDE